MKINIRGNVSKIHLSSAIANAKSQAQNFIDEELVK